MVMVSEFSVICRTCLAKKKRLKPINDTTISVLLSEIVQIEVGLDDGLPEGICLGCYQDVKIIEEFVQRCRASDRILREALANTSQRTESTTFDDNLYQQCNNDSQVNTEIRGSTNYELNSNESIEQIYLQTEEITEEHSSGDVNCYDQTPAEMKYEHGEIMIMECESDDDELLTREIIYTNALQLEEPNTILEITDDSFEENISPLNYSECEYCGDKYIGITALREHHRQNPMCKENYLKCKVCSKTFRSKYKLRDHEMSHSQEKPFECKLCLKTYRYQNNLRRHERAHGSRKLYVCNICGKGYTTNSARKLHLETQQEKNFHPPVISKKPKREKKLFQCDECGKKLSTKLILRAHKQTHRGERPFLCNYCGKLFTTKACLDIHLAVHSGIKTHECPYCEKRFALKITLRDHIHSHKGIRPYSCNFCDKSFIQSAHLKTHLKTHTGEKPHVCSVCSRAFALKGNLTAHMKIHS